jgi:hypothetical protein
MMRRIDYLQKRWIAATTGLSHETSGISSVSVVFTNRAGERVYGSLNPAHAVNPTDEVLREVLRVALQQQHAKMVR